MGGGAGSTDPPAPKKSQNIGFLSSTGLDLSQHSMLGHHRHASETPFKWRFVGGSTIAR